MRSFHTCRDRVDGGKGLAPPSPLKGLEHRRGLALEDGVDGRDLLLEDAGELLAGLLGPGGLAPRGVAQRVAAPVAALEELLEALVAVVYLFFGVVWLEC